MLLLGGFVSPLGGCSGKDDDQPKPGPVAGQGGRGPSGGQAGEASPGGHSAGESGQAGQPSRGGHTSGAGQAQDAGHPSDGGRSADARAGRAGVEAGAPGEAGQPTWGGEPGVGGLEAGAGPNGGGAPSAAGQPSGGGPSSEAGQSGQGSEHAGAPASGGAGGGDVSPDPEGGEGGELDPSLVTLRGPCAREDYYGGFVLTSSEALGTSLTGTVNNGVDPARVLELFATEGDCVLLRRPLLACDPPCSSGNTCGTDLVCQPMARAQDLGPIALEGAGELLEIEPLAPTNLYYAEPEALPSAGTPVRLSTDEGYAGEVALYGFGVEPLEVITGRWLLREGQPLVIRWIGVDEDTRSRISVELSVDQHGTTPLLLTCEAEDTGELEISATAVDALLAAGITGFPSARVERRTVDSVPVHEGCIDFRVTSSYEPDVAIEGYTPCSAPEQCPEGQTCNLALERCE